MTNTAAQLALASQALRSQPAPPAAPPATHFITAALRISSSVFFHTPPLMRTAGSTEREAGEGGRDDGQPLSQLTPHTAHRLIAAGGPPLGLPGCRGEGLVKREVSVSAARGREGPGDDVISN